LSLALIAEIVTVKEDAVAGMLNAVTVGKLVSAVGGSVIVTDALLLAETLPAASLAHA